MSTACALWNGDSESLNMRKLLLRSRQRIGLLLVCVLIMCMGCTAETVEGATAPVSAAPPAVADVDVDALFLEFLPGPSLPPDDIPDETISTDYVSLGLLRVCYVNESGAALKLQVLKDGASIAYNLKGDGSLEDFPLQYGDGEYTARIMQNIEGDQYFAVESITFDVTIEEENRVYLHSVQNIDWDYERLAIKAVRGIVSGSLAGGKEPLRFACTEDLYQYIVENIKYDHGKIFDLLYDYLPDVDETYLSEKGICYDYASLLAAMLRSIGIPAKLVKGYASYNPEVYHAWNEVYVDGRWIVIDSTKDAETRISQMEKNSQDYAKVYEY